MKSSITYLLLAACALLAGCGSEGAPQPPSLDLPQPVQDLRASRKGTKVTLDWTQPSQTTDREAAGRHLGETVICQGISDAPGQPLSGCPQEINRVSPKAAASSSGKSQNPASASAEAAPLCRRMKSSALGPKTFHRLRQDSFTGRFASVIESRSVSKVSSLSPSPSCVPGAPAVEGSG